MLTVTPPQTRLSRSLASCLFFCLTLCLSGNTIAMDAVKARLAPASADSEQTPVAIDSTDSVDSIDTKDFAPKPAGLANNTGLNADQFLHVDEAFKLDSNISDGVATLIWIIAPEHYLYRHAFSVQLEVASADGGSELLSLNKAAEFSQGIRKVDDYFGPVEVYYYQTTAELPLAKLQALSGSSADSLQLNVSYQGCADAGLCYPKQTRQVLLSASSANPQP